jgi:hypothetical protein
MELSNAFASGLPALGGTIAIFLAVAVLLFYWVPK